MTPIDAIDLAIILGVPILITRIVVGLSRPRRTSRLWTFALPTAALLFLFVRVSITRNLGNLVPSDDWISAASWVAVVATQAVAILFQWSPQALVDVVRRRNPRHGATG